MLCVTYVMEIYLCNLILGILTQILKEVKCVNVELRQKVTSLEEKVEGLHGPSVVTTKVKPSRKVRVNCTLTAVLLVQIKFLYT